MASTFTNRRNYGKPANGDGDWGTTYNDNFDKVEEDLSFSSSKHKKAMSDGSNFRSRDHWEQIAQSSGLGSVDDVTHGQVVFDGRYMYYAACTAETFVRYDTTGRFRDITSWEQMPQSSAQGDAGVDASQGFCQGVYTGRYIVWNGVTASTHVQFDTTGVFTDITSWEHVAVSSAQGGADVNLDQNSITFDGRFVYMQARNANTFVRYDTNEAFTAFESAWEQMDLRSAWGSSATTDGAFLGIAFDGRYVYHAGSASDTMIRYDTTGVFTAITSWEQIRMRSATGGPSVNDFFNGIAFDGRHVYYVPIQADSMIRFDTTGTFTDITDWEQLRLSSAIGANQGAAGTNGFSGGTFDGRYVYYCPTTNDSTLRYDTTAAFTDITSWEQINMGSGYGGASADNQYSSPGFDGFWVYYGTTAGDSYIRFRANITANPGPTEYDQVTGG